MQLPEVSSTLRALASAGTAAGEQLPWMLKLAVHGRRLLSSRRRRRSRPDCSRRLRSRPGRSLHGLFTCTPSHQTLHSQDLQQHFRSPWALLHSVSNKSMHCRQAASISARSHPDIFTAHAALCRLHGPLESGILNNDYSRTNQHCEGLTQGLQGINRKQATKQNGRT
jgi:hypothetical protein